MKDLIKNDPILSVILILILVTVLFIAHNCVYMWFHAPLDQITTDYWIKTQTFLGVTLSMEVLGGFSYRALKPKFRNEKKSQNEGNNLEGMINGENK